MNLSKPNSREGQAINSLAMHGGMFREYIAYLERLLAEQREANDILPLDQVQIGQGMARALSSHIAILKESAQVGP